MNKYFTYKVARLLPIFILPLLFSCWEIEDDPNFMSSRVKQTIYDGMQEWYYWNNELPQNIKVENYPTNEALLENLKFRDLDKWSYLTTRDAFNKAFTGQNAGHGVGFTIDENERIFLTFVYSESPSGKDGWQRGWEIIEVNGKPTSYYKRGNGYDLQLGLNSNGVTNTFKFRLPDGEVVQKTIAKADYQSNSVLYKGVVEDERKKIGYWVYNSFKATPNLEPTKSLEVEESMEYFQDRKIDELIVDLRYNGGGSVEVAEQLMNYLVPASATGKLMYTNSLNEGKSNLNEEQVFEKTGLLDLNRIIFITSRGSASASELIINCLSPYMDLVLIGDNTYGKPVGSFPLSGFYKILEDNDVELVPITFAIANADGKAAYFNGFPEEKRFKAALDFIRTGKFEEGSRLSYSAPSWAMIDNFKGLQKEFPVY
jgi:C-terminal processing protease CtpA/Prc